MNVLLVSPRFPWPAYSGDRLRATVWLDALAHANVALVAPPGPAPGGIRFHPARRSIGRLLGGVVRVIREGLPWQSLLAASWAWDDAIARARHELGPFDATVVILTRLHPWMPQLDGIRVLDAVDSLASNAHERARAGSILTRWLWRAEERRNAAAERRIEHSYDALVFVSEDECGERGTAISNGVAIRPLDEAARKYDFGFWGRLAYFANADAAGWLIEEIWPAIRASKPGATLVVAGADAPPSLRRAAARAGVTFLSPVEDMAALARDVRVAILPLRYGSGESTKMLEAAEAGCAVVATSRGVRGVSVLARHAVLAEDAQSLAREAVNLLTNTAAGRELRRVAVQHYARTLTLERLAALVRREAA